MDAQDRADVDAVAAASTALERQVRVEARRIRDKYLAPPHTTDFALLFLPTEGLYAEVLRRPGLFDGLQREFRVTLVRSEEHTSELQSLMRISYAVFCLHKKNKQTRLLINVSP